MTPHAWATATALAVSLSGCWGSSDWNPFARQPPPAAPVAVTPIDADAVTISEPTHGSSVTAWRCRRCARRWPTGR